MTLDEILVDIEICKGSVVDNALIVPLLLELRSARAVVEAAHEVMNTIPPEQANMAIWELTLALMKHAMATHTVTLTEGAKEGGACP